MRLDTIKTALRPALIGGALVVSAVAARADMAPPRVGDGIVFVEAGLFCPLTATGREAAPDTERGYVDVIDQIMTADFATTTVPGEVGIGFGIRFKLPEGAPSRAARIVTTHPPFGSPPVTTESYATTVHGDSTNASLFTFDFPYEIALGEWTLSVEIGGEIVLSQRFNVVPAEESFIRASMCDGPAMTS
jgi:hypothetical protein